MRQILVIGGSKDFRERLVSELQALGFESEALWSGEGVIRRLTPTPPDGLVISPDLPEMKIAALMSWIRGTTQAETIPVVAVVTTRDEEREAQGTTCDHIIRVSRWMNNLANEVRVRLEAEWHRRAQARASQTNDEPGQASESAGGRQENGKPNGASPFTFFTIRG